MKRLGIYGADESHASFSQLDHAASCLMWHEVEYRLGLKAVGIAGTQGKIGHESLAEVNLALMRAGSNGIGLEDIEKAKRKLIGFQDYQMYSQFCEWMERYAERANGERAGIIGVEVEIGQTRAVVAGFCKAPPAWGGQTVLYTKRSLAVRMSRETEDTVSFVLAKAEDGADPDVVAARVERETGLKARSSARFSSEIIDWMLKFSGVAEFFGVTILMGVVIGIAIVGQTFYLFSVENVKQFATLKAIGVGNRSVLGMIFLQASVVAVLGFAIGVGVASLFFAYFGPGTGGLRGMNMPFAVFAGTGVFIYIMVVASCFLSIRRVLTADPAIVFRN